MRWLSSWALGFIWDSHSCFLILSYLSLTPPIPFLKVLPTYVHFTPGYCHPHNTNQVETLPSLWSSSRWNMIRAHPGTAKAAGPHCCPAQLQCHKTPLKSLADSQGVTTHSLRTPWHMVGISMTSGFVLYPQIRGFSLRRLSIFSPSNSNVERWQLWYERRLGAGKGKVLSTAVLWNVETAASVSVLKSSKSLILALCKHLFNMHMGALAHLPR